MLLPFTYPWTFRNKLKNIKTVLDVGCGDGAFIKQINSDKKFDVVGVDLFAPYLRLARSTLAYKQVSQKDIRQINYKKNQFDAAISSQVIEHLTKKEGLDHIRKLEKYAKKIIIIGTPNGHFHQESYDGNKHQEHHSEWRYEEFKALGYKTYGQGFKPIYGEHGLINTFIGRLFPVKLSLFMISYLLSPYVYNHPEHAAHTIAVKVKKP
jgi:SAM-dependent methyltransferase